MTSLFVPHVKINFLISPFEEMFVGFSKRELNLRPFVVISVVIDNFIIPFVLSNTLVIFNLIL